MMSDDVYYDEMGVANNMDDLVKDAIRDVLKRMKEERDDEETYREKDAFHFIFCIKLKVRLSFRDRDYVEKLLYHFGIQKALEIWVHDEVEMSDDLPMLITHAIMDDMIAGEFSHRRWVAYAYPGEGNGHQGGEG